MVRGALSMIGGVVLSLAAGCGSSGHGPDDVGAQDAASDAERDAGGLDGHLVDGSPEGDTSLDAARDAPRDTSDGGAQRHENCVVDADLGSATGIDLVVATTEGEDDSLYPECAYVRGSSPDVVYRWVAPSSGTWVFDTLGSDLDTALHLRDLDCALVACSDDITESLLASRIVIDLEAGQELYVVVDGVISRAGAFHLSIQQGELTESDCGDGVDSDRDGQTDCSDKEDCSAAEWCRENDCGDGVDNEGDGFTDCRDGDCLHVEPCAESQCGDGIDGDGDFLVDCADDDCGDLEPCVEVLCDDGIDGDQNGATDCEDAACGCAPNCLPADPCPDEDLGSAIGRAVAIGETGGCSRRTPIASECPGDLFGRAGTGPERTFLWTAPRSGRYTFDTSGSSYDTTLYLLSGCDGPVLACSEDIVTAILQRSRITWELAQGESVIVVIDGWGGDSGPFILNILEGHV